MYSEKRLAGEICLAADTKLRSARFVALQTARTGGLWKNDSPNRIASLQGVMIILGTVD
jgi:hypothetical protein